MRFRPNQPVLSLLISVMLTGCTVGPDYVRPQAPIPEEFKELKGWKPAQPRDDSLSVGWWQIFDDPRLHALVEQVATANQSILQAEAQYRQAQHLVQGAQAAYLPIINTSLTASRFQAATGQNVAVTGVRNLFGQALGIAWEPDLWGGVSRQVEANTGNAQASAATVQAMRLSLQALLVDNYFQIRVLDAQKAVLDETVKAYDKTLTITRNRYAVGVLAKTDVVQAESQLETVRAQAIDLGVQRAKLEHAIAVLIGKPPAELSITAESFSVEPPAIPISLPSELLERRPDIAAAERKMAAANAQIGVAKAAYFPTLNLAATNGFQSTTADTLFTMARRYWALGPAGAALTLFDGGAKNAQYKQAIDAYDASVAAYRQTLLNGFQEVEDNLAATRILDQEKQVRDKAVAAAKQALALTMNQYQAGTADYLNVMASQTVALNNQLAAAQLQGQRFSASVQLIKALGGGWRESQLPTPEQADGETQWTDYLIFPVE
ncbi:efflux transporter outer membrane subunit [Methylomonas sp. LL1]|uniref:efflux transporter outer membrane subunit n=1 Tax=Methylomonas sp. LL1 TaxID=2785785 RepID=UPI0018C3E377|nr:efflux transporter outer membrane subunit [Methylomonas sp. LL1]QPK64835.1 efflux transporter outer membrane subunit [Methylomonas sp. LL1]